MQLWWPFWTPGFRRNTVSEFIIYLMAVFMVIGAVDRILGNRLGLGQEFENGVLTFGTLALSMHRCWPGSCGRW